MFNQRPSNGRFTINMKKSILLLAFWLVGVLAYGQSYVRGNIKIANSGEELVGANIILVGTGRGATSDLSGNFEIRNIPAGSYTLRATFLGFESFTREINIPSTEVIQINMNPSSLLTEEFIVYATRATDRTPTTFSKVDKSDIAKLNLAKTFRFC